MKDLLICFASKGREDYNKLMYNLMDSVKRIGWDGDCRFYSLDGTKPEHNGMPIINLNGVMPQPKLFKCCLPTEIPYQFKFGLIQKAIEDGYKRIFWMDSTMQLVKNISELLDKSSGGVMAFHNLGHDLYNYCSDKCFNLVRENCLSKINGGESPAELMHSIPQTWGGALGFDFNKPCAQHVFDDIVSHAFKGAFDNEGSTRAGFIAHRHDQATMSLLFWVYKIKLWSYGTIVTSEHDHEPFLYGKDFYIRYGR